MTDIYNNFISYCKSVFQGLKKIRTLRLSHLRKVFSLMSRREKAAMLALGFLAAANLFLSFRNFYLNHSVMAAADGGSFSEGILGQPNYINPLLAHQESDLALAKLVFSGLYKYDNQGQLVPDLADGMPQISEDQKQYTVNLKRNVKWHNDKPLTADDVVFTLQILKDPNFKSPLRSMWQSTNLEKLGDYSVRFSTKDISGPFIHNLTLQILPKSVWNNVESQNFLLAENNLKAIGSGPFAVKEIKKLGSGKVAQITFAPFEDYYNGKPKLSSFIVKFYDNEEEVLNALHSKEINGYGFVALGSNLHLEKGQDNIRLLSLPLPQYQVVFFNLNNKILMEPKVREALSLAADRRKIISEVFKEDALLPTSPLLLSAGLDRKPQNAEPDLQKAAKLLDESGWKIDPKTSLRTRQNVVMELGFLTNDYLLNSKASESLAQQWRELNIKVNLTVLPTKQLTDNIIRQRNFDILLFPQKFNADPDPFIFWHSSQVKDPGFNLTGFAEPAADKLITEARTTTNQEVRLQKYEQFDKMISEKTPILLLDQTIYIYALSSDIKNINLNSLYEPSQRMYDAANWYINEKRVWR